jgi:aminoglycoside phosphotransferase (APT) family kinase protein
MTQASRFAPKPATSTSADDVAKPLLVWLREQTTSAADYAEPPERISGGFDTQIWAFRVRGAAPPWDAPLVARIFRDGGVVQARFDAAVMRAVSDQGYPSPLVLAARLDTAPLGNAFIIMQRAPGVPMLSKLLGPGVWSMPVLLGRLHARLHTLDAVRFSDDLTAAGASPDGVLAKPTLEMGRAGIEHAQLDGLRPALDWLREHQLPDNETAVCHGDFHPLNVLVHGKRASVLDWTNARVADPGWDVGATVALMGFAPVDIPGFLMPFFARVRAWALHRYLRAYQRERRLDLARVRYFEAERLLGFLLEAGEYRQALRGVIPPLSKSTAFHDPRAIDAITERVARLTGVRVRLPQSPTA